jgi:hypothetical protein
MLRPAAFVTSGEADDRHLFVIGCAGFAIVIAWTYGAD